MPSLRRIVSSAALLTGACGLSWVGVQCWRGALIAGSPLLAFLGSVLLIIAAAFAIASVASISLLEKLLGPRRAPNSTNGSSEFWAILFEILLWW